MAAGIGNISIGFVADISKFMLGSEKVQSQLKAIGGPAKRLGGVLEKLKSPAGRIAVGFAAASTAAYGVASAFNEMSETAAQLDDIGDEADRLGIHANSLLKLHYAARQSGASAEDMTTALRKMLRTLGEARGGNKSSAAAFERLGLNIQKISKMEPDQTFREIAVGFSRIKNPADRAAAAVDIFGKNGLMMVGVLERGGDGLDKLAAKFDKLRPKLTDMDWKNIDILDRARKNAEESQEGAKQVLAARLSPQMTKFQNFRTGINTKAAGNADVISVAIENVFKNALGPVSNTIYSWFAEEGRKIEDMGPDALKAAHELDELSDSINTLTNTIKPAAMELNTATFSRLAQMEAAVSGGTAMEQIGQKQSELLKKIETNTRPANSRPQEVRL